MIDITKPTYFYDDRNKSDVMFKLSQVLYKDNEVCLCLAECTDPEYPVSKILFNLDTGKVLHVDFEFWIAANDIDFIEIDRYMPETSEKVFTSLEQWRKHFFSPSVIKELESQIEEPDLQEIIAKNLQATS